MKHLLKPVLTAICGLFFATTAWALEPCGQVVVDTAGVLKNISTIEAAAADLENQTGAEVRVRIAPDHKPQSNLDKHVEAIADTVCPAWTTDSGSRRSNLLIFWVTMNRQVGLYYGDLWAAELGKAWTTILAQKVKPRLRDGDFDAAFIEAIKQTSRVIEQAQNAPATPPVVERLTERVVVQSEPTDWTPIAWLLGIVAVLLIAILGGYRGLGILHAWQDRESKRRAKRQAVINTANDCLARFQTLNTLTDQLTAKLAAATAVADTDTAKHWQTEVDTLLRQADAVNEVFNQNADPATGNLTMGEYEEQLKAFTKVLDSLTAITQSLETVGQTIDLHTQLAKTLPAHEKAVSEILSASSERRKAIAAAGFKVFPDEVPASLFIEATALMEAKKFPQAQAKFDEAKRAAEVSAQVAEELPETKRQLEEVVKNYTNTQRTLVDRLPVVHEAYALMESKFAEVGYESVAGNGTEAERRLNATPEMLAAVNVLLDKQSWDQAEAALVGVGEVLREVESLLDAIIDQKNHLLYAERETEAELVEAKRSIRVAEDYLNDNPRDSNNGHRQTLHAAKAHIKEAESLSLDSKPDILKMFTLVTKADELADTVFAKAQDEKAQAERLRARAKRTQQEALHKIAEAQKYIRNHRSDVGRKARSKLAEAERLRHQLQSSNDTAEVLRLALMVSQLTDNSLRTAKSDFRQAESRRDDERRAQQRRSESSSSSSSWGSSSGFGGGSSSFGGSSGFGGGSSSW